MRTITAQAMTASGIIRSRKYQLEIPVSTDESGEVYIGTVNKGIT